MPVGSIGNIAVLSIVRFHYYGDSGLIMFWDFLDVFIADYCVC